MARLSVDDYGGLSFDLRPEDVGMLGDAVGAYWTSDRGAVLRVAPLLAGRVMAVFVAATVVSVVERCFVAVVVGDVSWLGAV